MFPNTAPVAPSSLTPLRPSTRIGLLLVNLGSPDAPTPREVGAYLREFLMDPEVIDLPAPLRWILVHLLIVPRRARTSAVLYRRVWTDSGSPLLVHSRAFTARLKETLADVSGMRIALAMRYGRPSIGSALGELGPGSLDRLIVFPLYPQYAQSSTLSVQKRVRDVLATLSHPAPEPEWIAPFYDDTRYIEAVRAVSAGPLEAFGADHVLFSFHGVPERHLRREHPTCLATPDCCEEISMTNRNCYRAQCVRTARSLAAGLGIPAEEYTIAFQSRLGRTPWIRPFTDEVIRDMPKRGIRRLGVLCPSFVSDCLETVDEISNRENERFLSAGGAALALVPSLNDHPVWIRAAADIVRDAAIP